MVGDGTDSLRLRRIVDGPRTLRSAFRRQRRYEIHRSNGERRVVSLRELDTLLNGRAYPADFWACVNAANEAFTRGDHDVLVEWPSGRGLADR